MVKPRTMLVDGLIMITSDTASMVPQLWEALQSQKLPRFFALYRIRGARHIARLTPDGMLGMTVDELWAYVARHVRFGRYRGPLRNKVLVPADPPRMLIRFLMATPFEEIPLPDAPDGLKTISVRRGRTRCAPPR